jgi:hypothetical protein
MKKSSVATPVVTKNTLPQSGNANIIEMLFRFA